jgi:flagellar hook-basal body complex protein FliE
MTTLPVHAIVALTGMDAASTYMQPASAARSSGVKSFSQMLLNGIDRVDQKLKSADAMVTSFALDDSIPPHRVIFALEEAQHSLGMLMQVRSHLVEAYQGIMRIQL